MVGVVSFWRMVLVSDGGRVFRGEFLLVFSTWVEIL